MRLAEREETAQVPGWAVGFLRDRCATLQAQLVNPCDPIFALEGEEDCIHCWTLLLVAAADLPAEAVQTLEALQLLHARIAQRLERGGVQDISEEVEHLVRTVLVAQLQRQTDDAVDALV
jgi:hypothetical protein